MFDQPCSRRSGCSGPQQRSGYSERSIPPGGCANAWAGSPQTRLSACIMLQAPPAHKLPPPMLSPLPHRLPDGPIHQRRLRAPISKVRPVPCDACSQATPAPSCVQQSRAEIHAVDPANPHEGYTPALPAVRIRNNPDSKQDRQFIVIGFTTFSHSTPLHCAIRPLGTLFSFLSPPPPPLIHVCWGLGLG